MEEKIKFSCRDVMDCYCLSECFDKINFFKNWLYRKCYIPSDDFFDSEQVDILLNESLGTLDIAINEYWELMQKISAFFLEFTEYKADKRIMEWNN